MSDTYADEAEEIIYVKEIKLPDISKILELDRNTNFSLFITKHQELAGALIDLFMGTLLLYFFQRNVCPSILTFRNEKH